MRIAKCINISVLTIVFVPKSVAQQSLYLTYVDDVLNTIFKPSICYGRELSIDIVAGLTML